MNVGTCIKCGRICAVHGTRVLEHEGRGGKPCPGRKPRGTLTP